MMLTYSDAIAWCIKRKAVFRFVERGSRPDFVFINQQTPGTQSLELMYERDGRPVAVHVALDTSVEPSKSVAIALISAVTFFMNKESCLILSVN